MLFDNDVVTDGEPKPGAFSGRFGRKEWIEHLLLHVQRNASAVISDRYLDMVPKVLGGGSKSWFVVRHLSLQGASLRRKNHWK